MLSEVPVFIGCHTWMCISPFGSNVPISQPLSNGRMARTTQAYGRNGALNSPIFLRKIRYYKLISAYLSRKLLFSRIIELLLRKRLIPLCLPVVPYPEKRTAFASDHRANAASCRDHSLFSPDPERAFRRH